MKARDLIKEFEGLRLDAYRCPAGKLTIGYGHTGDVSETMKITEHQADVILDHDIECFEVDVRELAPLANENQIQALTSFAFNVGIAALMRSSLLRLLNEGDEVGAAEQFDKWVYAGGRVLPGLVKRRAAERALFEGKS